jgi:hypothetical protein
MKMTIVSICTGPLKGTGGSGKGVSFLMSEGAQVPDGQSQSRSNRLELTWIMS